ncbi:MAG: phosphotransferase [Alphaproteobacteria bacterium]|nr:phosphotransferase [Alphaproteobacteria bacterium]
MAGRGELGIQPDDAAVQPRAVVGDLVKQGTSADIHEWDETRVIKLYGPNDESWVTREAAMHAAAEASGLPVPRVWGVRQVEDRWGLILDRVSVTAFGDRVHYNDPKPYLEEMARLHTLIHQSRVTDNAFRTFKQRLSPKLAGAPDLLAGLDSMPDGDRLCHGDFHLRNILGDLHNPVIIDWPLASRGDPAADACCSYIHLKRRLDHLEDLYLDAYCRLSGTPRETVLAWLPYMTVV